MLSESFCNDIFDYFGGKFKFEIRRYFFIILLSRFAFLRREVMRADLSVEGRSAPHSKQLIVDVIALLTSLVQHFSIHNGKTS